MAVVDAINHTVWILGAIGAVMAGVAWLIQRANITNSSRQ